MRKPGPQKNDGVSGAAVLLWKSLDVYSTLCRGRKSDPHRERRNEKTRPGGNAVLSVCLCEIMGACRSWGMGVCSPS